MKRFLFFLKPSVIAAFERCSLSSMICLFLSSFLVLSSCKKSNTNTPSESFTRSELLSLKPWIQTAGRTKIGSGDWAESFSMKPACRKDNEYVFKSDGSFNYNEGKTKCDPADSQVTDQGTWLFTAGETVISTTESTGGGDDLYVMKLDKTTLVFEERYGSTVNEYTMSHP